MTAFKSAKFFNTPDSQEAKKPHAIQNSILAFKRIDEQSGSLHQHKSTIVSNFCY